MTATTTTPAKQGGFHYAYLIVAACVCMCAACSLVVNCVGIYAQSVTTYFGVATAQYMLYFTIVQLTMTITLPIWGKILNSIDLRAGFTAGAILIAVGNLVLSFAQSIWMFYVGGVLLGAGVTPLLFLAVPKLLGAWCAKRVGFFTGLALAFTGVGGVIFNPVQNVFIQMGPEGWRTGYLVAAVIMLVLTLPFTIFVVRNSPADKGLEPYGYDPNATEDKSTADMNKGTMANKAMKTAAFFAIAIFGGLIALNQTVYQFLPKYVSSFTDMPNIVALSAVIASVTMAGLSIGKVVLGAINDKSPRFGVFFSIGLGVVGVLLMLLFPSVAPLLLIGGFFFGFVYAATTVETTLLTRSVFGNRDYATIYSRVSVVSSLGGAVAATLWGIVVDLPNGFQLMFVISLVVMIVAFLLAMFSLSQAHKYANATD